MAEIIMYSTTYCPYCSRARDLLGQKKVPYVDIQIDKVSNKRQEMITRSGRTTVPQIFVNGQHIGGYDDLYSLDKKGQLDQLLKG